MTDELDRILSEDAGPGPSPEFSAIVMAAIRREADTPPPLPFPWRRFAPGFAISVVLAIAAGASLPAGATATVQLDPRWAAAALWAGVGLVAGAVPAWVTVRLAR